MTIPITNIQCLDPFIQNLLLFLGAGVGLTVVGYMVRGTLDSRGIPSDMTTAIGIVKVAMRHFQLAGGSVDVDATAPALSRSHSLTSPVSIPSTFGTQTTQLWRHLFHSSGLGLSRASLQA